MAMEPMVDVLRSARCGMTAPRAEVDAAIDALTSTETRALMMMLGRGRARAALLRLAGAPWRVGTELSLMGSVTVACMRDEPERAHQLLLLADLDEIRSEIREYFQAIGLST